MDSRNEIDAALDSPPRTRDEDAPTQSPAVAQPAPGPSIELLRASFQQAGVGIGLLDLEGRYTDVNEKFAEILGYAPSDLKALRVWDVTHPDDLDLSRQHVADLLGQRVRDVVQEKRYLRKDGSVLWSRTSVSLLKDDASRPQRLISVIEDITAQKVAQEALRRTNEFNRSIIESSRDCIKMLALDGTLLWVSEIGLSALCIDDLRDVIGRSWIDFWEADDRHAARAAVQAAAAGASGSFVGRFPATGECRWWDVAVTPMRDVDGKPESLLVVSRDISDRIRAEQERNRLLESERAARVNAEYANRMKDEFLATLSHELRTPLSAILGWARLLRLQNPSPEQLARGLESIERNARIQTKLIEELLDMSRIASGTLRLELAAIDPAVPLTAALDSVRPMADARRIALERDLEAGLAIEGDSQRLQQVASNLLSNAIKFTPEGGNVRVTLRRSRSSVEIAVTDTGIGIDPEFMPHLFGRFRQADGSTARKYGGLGLGLSLVKHLVQMHGGDVVAESAGKGQGATFRVRLPIAMHAVAPPPSPTATPEEAGVPDDADLGGLRILVVDDDNDGREVVERLLADRGAQIVAARSGEEALRALAQRHIDMIVSDIGMPAMDGYELMRRVRSQAAPAPRAIALTAFARPEDRARALEAGFDAHVAKPVNPGELLLAISRLRPPRRADAARYFESQ